MTEPKSIFFRMEPSNTGEILSPVFDSRLPGTEWNRLHIQLCGEVSAGETTGTSVIITVCCAEQPEGPWQSWLFPASADLLLYGCKGRFLQIRCSSVMVFQTGCVSYPKMSFAEYLPAIYQGNSELERFFAIFQTRYLELEEQIERCPRELSADTASPEALDWLANLFGLPSVLCSQLGRAACRKLSAHAFLLAGLKGTAECWRLLVLLVSGRRSVVSSGNPAVVMVLGELPSFLRREALEALLDWYRPLCTRLRLEIIRRDAGIGEGMYLGVNTWLKAPRPLIVEHNRLCGDIALIDAAKVQESGRYSVSALSEGFNELELEK